MTIMLSAPFPYFGGKARIASEVWARLGNVDGYIEPFFGSGAVLLGRPGEDWGTETVNDFDDLIDLSTTIAEGTAHLAVLRTEVAIVDRVRYQQAAGEAKAQEVKPDAGA